MKIHLYEFRSAERKLKCLCGWERRVKTTDPAAAEKLFQDHRREAAAAAGK